MNIISVFKRTGPFLKPIITTKSPPPKVTEVIKLCKLGYLYDAIQVINSADTAEIKAKPIVYASLLQTCNKSLSFNLGLQIHCHVIKSGLETDRFVGNSLLTVYFKLGSDFSETRGVFNGLYYKDVISWTSMISGYVQVGEFEESLKLFWEMLGSEIDPNGFTLSAVIKACSELGKLRLGWCFHGMVFRHGFDSNHVISSALIDMYGRNYRPMEAHRLFNELLEPDVICWTSVISAFTRNDQFQEALSMFFSMLRNHKLIPDSFTLGTVLTACGNMERLKQGKQIHCKVVTSGLCRNVIVESSLMDMYGKCGSIGDAQGIFDRMANRNSVSRCALLGAYCQNKKFETVLQLFRKMEDRDIYSFGTVLRACAGIAAVRQGKEVHCQYMRRGGWSNVIVESALVDLYAKCGCIDFAQRVFVHMEVRNAITWNSMICGLAQNGRAEEALQIFHDMIQEGTKPDYISFIGVLFACSHTGLVDEGRKHFLLMSEEYKIRPGVEHYNCMVDLLGRAGMIKEAEELLEKAECRRDPSLWAVLLGACSTSTESVTAERIARKVMELDPENHLSYVLLANIYRTVGRWRDAEDIRRSMDDKSVKKMAGKSWI
ncbi:hypothetical protein SAY87_030434 [Trapa incisa]|uniref:Pentatricopeptide repeat-containing protein n=1 Tax=Trapa incisa TaxID=236973 RepID=A0AAN7KN92_9MYRT|nr:hypothetical protein SAY87_030434 [Trapa incisa]